MTLEQSPGSASLRIEIMGVAGAGKSTLAEELCRGRAGWVVADSLHTRVPGHLKYVAMAAPGVLRLVRAPRPTWPRPLWSEVKSALYVSIWHRYLAEHEDIGGSVVLLDQGPLFTLARFLCESSPLTGTAAFARWWHGCVETWAAELDGVVWLDAPNDVLRGRIEARVRAHQVKGRPRGEAYAFLDAYRRAMTVTLDTVSTGSALPLLTIDTSSETSEQTAARAAAWVSMSSKRIPTAAAP